MTNTNGQTDFFNHSVFTGIDRAKNDPCIDLTIDETTKGLQKQRLSNLTGLFSRLPKRVYARAGKGQPYITYRQFDTGKEIIDFSITAAVVPIEKTVNGVIEKSEKVYYPGLVEDRVEEALAYLASQGDVQLMPGEIPRIGVTFTLREIKAVLIDVFDKECKIERIKQALTVLSRSTLELPIELGGKKYSHANTRISNLTLVTQEVYHADNTARCYCELHWAFANDVRTGNFCVYDLKWQASLDNELAEDLMKRLSFNYRHANSENSYHFKAKNQIENTSIGFEKRNLSRNWQRLKVALNILQEHDVISHSELKPIKADGKGSLSIADYIVTVWPTQHFIQSVKARKWLDKERGLSVSKAKQPKKKVISRKSTAQYESSDDIFG